MGYKTKSRFWRLITFLIAHRADDAFGSPQLYRPILIARYDYYYCYCGAREENDGPERRIDR